MNFISHLIVGFQGQSGNRHGNRGRKQAKKAASTDLGAGEAGMSLRCNWMWFYKLLTSSTVFKQKGAFCFLKSCPICYRKWCCLLYRALKIHSFNCLISDFRVQLGAGGFRKDEGTKRKSYV